jgi:hypothetical protein
MKLGALLKWRHFNKGKGILIAEEVFRKGGSGSL